MNKIEAKKKVIEIEQRAKDKYVDMVEWDMIIDSLSEDEKEELNEAYKKAYGEEYPSFK